MRTIISILICLVLVLGSIQMVYSGIPSGDLNDKKVALLNLSLTESFDFRVQTIESEGILLDTVTTVNHKSLQFLPNFSNGGRLLFTPTSLFANVIAGNIEMELLAYNGGVATVNLNAGNSIEFEPESFTITSSTTNTESVLLFIDEAEFFVHPGERKQIVSVDIAPINPASPNNTGEHGTIPVVIYGSENLDVSSININSLFLIGRGVKTDRIPNSRANINHINNDSYPDLVVAFNDNDRGFLKDLSYATLLGNLADGTTISGKADIMHRQ